jgi:hypothetical protein
MIYISLPIEKDRPKMPVIQDSALFDAYMIYISHQGN